MQTAMQSNSNTLNNLNLPIFNHKDATSILNSNINKNNVLSFNKCKFDYISSPKQNDKNLNSSLGSAYATHTNISKKTPNKKKGSNSQLNTGNSTNKKKLSMDKTNSILNNYGLKTQSDKHSLLPDGMQYLDETILES